MAVTFHTLTVKEVRQETPDCVSVAFDVPDSLKDTFQYIPGQYVTLRADINGEDIRRSYSICSSPTEADFRVAVKQVPEGKFSTFANQVLKKGDTLRAMPPMGNFHATVAPVNDKNYVAFAAGSGITPILSILKTVLEQEPKSHFSLFYGNKTTESIIFHEEIEQLKNRYMHRLSVHHVLSREHLGTPLYKGRINAEKTVQFAKLFFNPTEVDAFFLCGPQAMIFDVKDTLTSMGVDASKVHFELFTTADMPKPKAKTQQDEPAFDAEITIILDGDAFDMKVKSDGASILDAALKYGADLPFACKGGVCCTCRAKVVEGKVRMDVNYALEQDELDAGYVLTCQSHPLTDKVVVDFDA